MRRGFWFAAGAGAGAYAVTKARRTAETFTRDGFRDRLAGVSIGARLLSQEIRLGMAVKEDELHERFGDLTMLDRPGRPGRHLELTREGNS